MRVVICGGGVIGALPPISLSRRGIDVIDVERTEVAAAASASRWLPGAGLVRPGTPLDALRDGASDFNDALPMKLRRLGYRRMTAYTVSSFPEVTLVVTSGQTEWLPTHRHRSGLAPRNHRIIHPRAFHHRDDERGAEPQRRSAPRRITGLVAADGMTVGGVE